MYIQHQSKTVPVRNKFQLEEHTDKEKQNQDGVEHVEKNVSKYKKIHI